MEDLPEAIVIVGASGHSATEPDDRQRFGLGVLGRVELGLRLLEHEQSILHQGPMVCILRLLAHPEVPSLKSDSFSRSIFASWSSDISSNAAERSGCWAACGSGSSGTTGGSSAGINSWAR